MYKNLSKTEQEFIKQVKQNGGGLVHNLSDPLHYAYTIERLGGEELLKEQFPRIHEMLTRTKEAACRNQTNDIFAPDENGLSNDIHIRSVNYVKKEQKTEVSAKMNVGLTKTAPYINVDARLLDAETGEVLDIISKHVSNAGQFLAELRKGLIQEKKTRSYTVIANFQYGGNEGIGVHYTEVYEDLKVYAEEDILDSVEVIHPTLQGYFLSSGFDKRDAVKVLYNRENADCDYYYQVEVEDCKARMKLPVSVKVKVNENFRITGMDEERSGYMMIKNGELKDSVHYYGDLDAGSYLRSIPGSAEEERIFLFTLPDEWENTLNTTVYHSCQGLDLTGSYSLMVEHTDGFKGTVGILFSSEEEQQGEKTGKVKKISILWGCLSKDTPILMEDGRFRPAGTLEPGEKVKNKGGSAVTIKNVVTGREKSLVVIKTEQGKEIKVTRDHPVLTEKGMKKAEQVCYLEMVETCDGPEQVTELYLEDYDDLIYSFQFDQPQIINCNGIYTGDFDLQNRAPVQVQAAENAISGDPLLVDEMCRLSDYLSRERK